MDILDEVSCLQPPNDGADALDGNPFSPTSTDGASPTAPTDGAAPAASETDGLDGNPFSQNLTDAAALAAAETDVALAHGCEPAGSMQQNGSAAACGLQQVTNGELVSLGASGRSPSPLTSGRFTDAALPSTNSALSFDSDRESTSGGTWPSRRQALVARNAAHWQENASHCSLCGAALGKRRMNPRHHCRLCGRCVCAACSASSVTIEGLPGLHRSCNPCVAINLFKERMTRIGNEIRVLGVNDASQAEVPSAPRTVDEALSNCEAQLTPLNQKLRSVQLRALQAEARAGKLEVELRAAQEANAAAQQACLQISERLAKLAGVPSDSQKSEESLQDVLELCNARLAAVEQMAALPLRLDSVIALCESSLQPLRDARDALQHREGRVDGYFLKQQD